MDILIRPFERDDLDPLYFLDQRCTAPGARLSYERLLSSLLDKEVTAVVMVEDMPATRPPMLGTLIVHGNAERRSLDVLALMVDPDFRRLGLARHLMRWAMHLAATRGLEELAVIQESPNSAPFLEALGFKRTDEMSPGFREAEPKPRWTLTLSGLLASGEASHVNGHGAAPGGEGSEGETLAGGEGSEGETLAGGGSDGDGSDGDGSDGGNGRSGGQP